MKKNIEEYVRSILNHYGITYLSNEVQLVDMKGEQLQLVGIDDVQSVNKLKDLDFDVVVGPESRGFIFGVPVAYNMHKAFIPVRKKGKLPCETVEIEYDLEYGSAVIEMHKDSIKPGQKVVIIDDLMATGGTIEAIVKLVERLGGIVVKIAFLMELEYYREIVDGRKISLDIYGTSYLSDEEQSVFNGYLNESIKYCGDKAQWDIIEKGSKWDNLTDDYTITYNYTGE